jgi:RNA recognition motif-containing protein|tara:strand:+ start:5927 stop:6262 length:336 start_codon:yes stop_codon:yes gene_type:complete
MNTKIYVGNLSFNATDDELKQLFAEFGNVSDVFIVKDRATGRSRGFAFVTMDNADSMNAAIEALNESEFDGRALVVNEARPKEENDRSSGGGSRGGFSNNRGGFSRGRDNR